MKYISKDQVESIRNFVFRHGRLLERQFFVHVFERDNKTACIKALSAYQNPDGGFGNGIEPDILCPESSAIATETALFFLDHFGSAPPEIMDPLVRWLEENQTATGEIPHPPQTMTDYPHERWWKNPDGCRVLSIAALLSKLGVKTNHFHERVKTYYATTEKKTELAYYDYPYFLYTKYCSSDPADKELYHTYQAQVKKLCETSADHFPLFSAWFDAADQMSQSFLEQEAERVITHSLQSDGGLELVYEHLPWWKPIWTMTCISSLKRLSLL